MFIVVKNTETGDMPFMIPEECAFWFKTNKDYKTLRVFIYFKNVTTKELEYKFKTLDDLKEASKDVSRQVLEIQNRINNQTFYNSKKVI